MIFFLIRPNLWEKIFCLFYTTEAVFYLFIYLFLSQSLTVMLLLSLDMN